MYTGVLAIIKFLQVLVVQGTYKTKCCNHHQQYQYTMSSTDGHHDESPSCCQQKKKGQIKSNVSWCFWKNVGSADECHHPHFKHKALRVTPASNRERVPGANNWSWQMPEASVEILCTSMAKNVRCPPANTTRWHYTVVRFAKTWKYRK